MGKKITGIDCRDCGFWANFKKRGGSDRTGVCFLEVNNSFTFDNDQLLFWDYADRFYRDSVIPNCKTGLSLHLDNPKRIRITNIKEGGDDV